MKARAIIKELMERQGLGFADLGARSGRRTSIVFDQLSDARGTDDMGVDALHRYMTAMDYKIVVMPRNTRLPSQDCIVVDPSEKENVLLKKHR